MTNIDTLMAASKTYSLLSREEENELAEQMKSEDPIIATEARNLIISANIRFVTHLAHGYARTSETPLDEYVSAGLEAMVKNAHKFDPTKANFCTFMKPWIRKAFQEIHYSDSMIAVPRHRHITIRKVNRVAEELVHKMGAFVDITNEMVAEAAGLSVEEVEECLSLQGNFLNTLPSLNSSISGEDESSTLMDVVADTYSFASDDMSGFSDDMQDALDALSPLEAQVILMTAGLHSEPPMSVIQISKALEVSQKDVREALKSARRIMADSL